MNLDFYSRRWIGEHFLSNGRWISVHKKRANPNLAAFSHATLQDNNEMHLMLLMRFECCPTDNGNMRRTLNSPLNAWVGVSSKKWPNLSALELIDGRPSLKAGKACA